MITVLIPLYNGIEFLCESYLSVYEQTFKDIEVIIGINGYGINNEKVNNIYNQVLTIVSDIGYINTRIIIYNTTGKCDALNAMVKDSKYDYIAILDVDDIWLNNKLEKQIKYIKEGYEVVGTKTIYFGEQNYIPNIPVEDLSNHDFLTGNAIINSSSVIKKEYVFYIDNYKGLEDYDLWIRLYFKGVKFFNVPEVLCKHRIHKESFFNNTNHLDVPLLVNKYKNMNKIYIDENKETNIPNDLLNNDFIITKDMNKATIIITDKELSNEYKNKIIIKDIAVL